MQLTGRLRGATYYILATESVCFASLPLVFDSLRGYTGSIVLRVSPLTSLMLNKRLAS